MAIYFNKAAPEGWGVDETGHIVKVPVDSVVINGQFQYPFTEDGQGGVATNFYKVGTSYYRVDSGAKILNVAELQALAKAGGREVKAPLPVQVTPPSSPQTPSIMTDANTINGLYQKYFNRSASSAEIANWQKESAGTLDNFLKQEQIRYAPPPVQNPPVQTTPAQTPPVQTPPVQTPPVQTPPVQTTPVQNPPPPMPSGSSIVDKSLIKFTSDPNGAAEGDASTVWLIDAATQQLRPFMSEAAFNNHFGSNAQTAWNSIKTMSVAELSPTGSLANFKTLDHTFGIQSDGTISKPDFSAKNVLSYYGNQNTASEQLQMQQRAIDVLELIKTNMDTLLAEGTLRGFTKESLDSVFLDHDSLAKMINAIAFGKYDGNDVTKEAIRLAMVKEGRTELADKILISDTQAKSVYMKTTAYQTASSMPALAIPGEVAEKLMSAVTNPKYFQEGVYSDLTSLKENMDKIGTTLFDLIEQGSSATTDREHQVAQTNYENFRDQMKKSYGITLSKNAIDAWGQIMSFEKTATGAGLAGSGFTNETVDQYLKQVRASDSVSRMEKLNKEEQQEMTFYTGSASPEQIAALIAKDQASGLPKEQWKSIKFGLLPDEGLKNQFDVETIFQKLKADQPEVSDWELRLKAQATRDQILDKNGNFLSTLYGNLAKTQVQNMLNKTAYQQQNVLANEQKANAKIFDQFTDFGITDPATAFGQGQAPEVPAYVEPVKTSAEIAAEMKQSAAYQSAVQTPKPVEIPSSQPSSSTVSIKDNRSGNVMTVSQDAWNNVYKGTGNYSLSSGSSPGVNAQITAPVTVPKSLLPTSPVTTPAPTSAKPIPWKAGFLTGKTAEQQAKLTSDYTALMAKPIWDSKGVDLANWNYVTGQKLTAKPTI